MLFGHETGDAQLPLQRPPVRSPLMIGEPGATAFLLGEGGAHSRCGHLHRPAKSGSKVLAILRWVGIWGARCPPPLEGPSGGDVGFFFLPCCFTVSLLLLSGATVIVMVLRRPKTLGPSHLSIGSFLSCPSAGATLVSKTA